MLLAGAGLAGWLAVIVVPLGFLFISSFSGPAAGAAAWPVGRIAALTGRSFALAGGIAALAVVLGYLPGRCLGTTRRPGLMLALILAPLLLPRYVAYYAWWLPLSPTTAIGRFLAQHGELSRFVHGATTWMALVLWFWPLAALLIGQGWRGMDEEVLQSARLEAGKARRFARVTLPLLAPSLVLAFGVCLVLALSELGTFDLAGIETLGTKIGLELARTYQLTGSAAATARAGAPLTVVALVVGIALSRRLRGESVQPPAGPPRAPLPAAGRVVVALLVGLSVLGPLGLLVGHVSEAGPYRDFWRLHSDEVGWSLITAAGAAGLALVIAAGALLSRGRGRLGRWLSGAVYSTIFLAMFLPGALIGISLLRLASSAGLPASIRGGWYFVSLGQAARFAGLALIVLQLARDSRDRHLAEMASTDGASAVQRWRYVHLPRVWPTAVAAFVLVAMFSMTELAATMVLLPAGVPNFAQSLLNQMHYLRDQQVIASCLALVGVYAAAAGLIAGLVWLIRARPGRLVAVVALAALAVGGCESKPSDKGSAKVLGVIGRSGPGDGEFIYPRAIDLAGDGTIYVADKTGRIQRLSRDGRALAVFRMPQVQAGKTTGISLGPDGNLYVADTHYHRVVVFSPAGKIVREFGSFGTGGGQFVYPTDVAFAPDGRIFVSEYGGNDRVSVFTAAGEFLSSFGSRGGGAGELSRPSALCVDSSAGVLYVADACNHRIARYNLDGRLLGYMASAGQGRGQLRYPYDLALLPDGRLLVCEYGNNRIQLFSRGGESLGVFGGPGRRLGQLAYPWAVAADAAGRVYVVDAGNDRVQIWDNLRPY